MDNGECGLDVDSHARCAMERTGSFPDYFQCPIVTLMRPLLKAGRSHIAFKAAGLRPTTLAEWEDGRS